MQLTEAAILDRKSGGAEGPVVRPSHSRMPWGYRSPFITALPYPGNVFDTP